MNNEKELTEEETSISLTEEIETLLNKYLSTLDDLMLECIKYINDYDIYVDKHIRDASRLKSRVKEMLVKAVINEL